MLDALGYLVVFLLGGIFLPLVVTIGGNLGTPWVKARLDRILAWYVQWANDRKTKTLAALDREEAEIRKFHDDSAELLRYVCFRMVWLVYQVLAMAGVFVIINYSDFLASIAPLIGPNRSAATLGTLVILSLLSFMMFRVATVGGRVRNVYYFNEWEEYVARRRAQLTKAGDSKS